MNYEAKITEVTIAHKETTTEPQTVVSLVDEGGGGFITLRQEEDIIRLDDDELKLVYEAADQLLGVKVSCKD